MENNIFGKMRIYFCGSIRGTPEPDPEFAWKLIQFMKGLGADVLSEHVGGRNKEEMERIRQARMPDVDFSTLKEPWFVVRQRDVEWVDKATHMIALVNGASHGVGMEIQRALDKPKMGKNFTPILCLLQDVNKLTWMIRGINQRGFYICQYFGLEQAQVHIRSFLEKYPCE